MNIRRRPYFRIWIPGIPKSQQSRGSKVKYIQRIKDAVKEIVPCPIESPRIDIEIYFKSKKALRSDIDNVIKPILDALIGLVYFDDKQVRSVRAMVIPSDDAISLSGWYSKENIKRLLKSEGKEFFIDIYCGLHTYGPGLEPKKLILNNPIQRVRNSPR